MKNLKKSVLLISLIFLFIGIAMIGYRSNNYTYASSKGVEQSQEKPKQSKTKFIGVAVGVLALVAIPSFVGMIFVYKKKQKIYEEAKQKLIKQLQEQKAQEVDELIK